MNDSVKKNRTETEIEINSCKKTRQSLGNTE